MVFSAVLCRILTPSFTEPLSLPDSDTRTLVKSSSSYSSSFISVTAATLFSDDSSDLSDDESAERLKNGTGLFYFGFSLMVVVVCLSVLRQGNPGCPRVGYVDQAAL